VAVIGAGIMGASVAYHLARRGAFVTLIDKGQPAGECTGKAFAWIGSEDPSSPLRSQTLEDYRRLERDLSPALHINWSGSLVWRADPAGTEHAAKARAAAGYDIYLMERDEIARAEPNLREPPILAAFETGAGSVEPLATTQVLVRAAQESGARVQFDVKAAELVVAGDRVTGVRVGTQVLNADFVIAAAGVGTNALMEGTGISLPIESSPAMLVRLKTPSVLVNRIVASESREVRHFSEGIMVSPETDLTDGPKAAAERVLTDVQRMLTGAETIELDGAEIGWRPMPADGLPIVGFVPGVEGLYLTVTHAGVNYAPAIGRLASVEIIDELSVRLFDACRPARFLNNSRQTAQGSEN
jgi:glycine/D-amino acid oxidase-like deaminating enzyme